mmetsp:Transcript_11135/g.18912  ORF Transcript_11135/g.18912 Transcript_11135/m.18912 type:complete len:197 (-) Transcript_11135:225-815(-)
MMRATALLVVAWIFISQGSSVLGFTVQPLAVKVKHRYSTTSVQKRNSNNNQQLQPTTTSATGGPLFLRNDDDNDLDRQTEYLASTRDPFSYIRIAIWALLGLGGLAGVVTTFISSGGIFQSLTNFVINVVVTIAMAGALYFEFQLGDKGREIIRDEMENPMLKGDSGFFVDTERKRQEEQEAETPLVGGEGPPPEE